MKEILRGVLVSLLLLLVSNCSLFNLIPYSVTLNPGESKQITVSAITTIDGNDEMLSVNATGETTNSNFSVQIISSGDYTCYAVIEITAMSNADSGSYQHTVVFNYTYTDNPDPDDDHSFSYTRNGQVSSLVNVEIQ
jgi:hypothetical protein